jgi:hypothetical protein
VRRHCNGSDPALISRYGDPCCPCGASFDDNLASRYWPHAELATPRDVTDVVPDLPACYTAPIGVRVHGPGCVCPEPQ